MSIIPTPPKLKNPPTIPAETAAKTPLPTLLLSEVKPITIYIYDSAPLARAIRRAFVDDPNVSEVYSEMLTGGTEKITVWKGATL